MKTTSRGFTVLEFLIVIGIMTILIGLILVGLTAARKNARDQGRVSQVQSVVVGLAQFYDICRMYPPTLDGTIAYPCLDNKTLGSLMADIDAFAWNTASGYHYAALADPLDPGVCTGFHIGSDLETTSASYSNKSGAPASGDICNGSVVDFDGTGTNIFDLKK